ncbi:MAG: CPBP family intramembrane metalloprotease [Aphanocapsa sp. GSE-SYN-MK-11-07L]|jgi:hypothetical protein|nr:CPBP family intramembrane metalloprotease [Aphanocapsa sp. GSE-SYN-MK-11-07L]
MTLKRLILIGLTLIVSLLIGLSLLDSLFQPQAQSQLELYQTDLVLQASEWRDLETEDKTASWQKLLGGEPIQNGLQQYNEMRRSLQKSLEQALKPDLTGGDRPPGLPPALLKQQLAQLDLRIGLLSARADQTQQAQQTWATVAAESTSPRLSDSAQILAGLWSQPPRVLTQAEATLTTTLKGWFRYQALQQLYQVQPQPEALAKLDLAEQAAAESAALRLAVVGGIPTLGGLFGSGLWLFWLVKTGIKTYRQQNSDPATAEAGSPIAATSVPWPSETIWQVMVLWFTAFFGVSLAFVPLLARLLGVTAGSVSPLIQAAFALLTYSLLMATGLTILYVSIRPFVAQPLTWLPLKLTGNWFWWGLAGYFAVLPLVFVVSLINQQLLQDHGGGNPILEIILGSHDRLTIGILWFMVAVLAPVFEETLFRGFFLTSLTRYLPTWSAIALSGGVFAIAHLNLADVLPLTVLGMGLGYVYLRSGNLLASMLLHGIWNSGSFLGLLLLSSSQSG